MFFNANDHLITINYTLSDFYKKSAYSNDVLFFQQNPFYLFSARGLLGESNNTPLQNSCLEDPMDGGAWWAAVHGVSKSWIRLSDFTFTLTLMHWRRKWQPTPVFLPGEPQGWGSLVGFCLWGCTESDTTEVI